MKTYLLTLMILVGLATVEAGTLAVTIIASGESHAMLKPCECPEGPGGGFAERATVLKKTAVGDRHVLLLDAGGFSGGGIYDSYTQGRATDSQRTIAAIKAMAAMRYDAVGIGDEELQYGAAWLARTAEIAGLPLVSANCMLRQKKRFVPPSLVVVKSGIRFGITSCASTERLFPVDDSCMVEEPFSALRKIWKELVSASDCQVILSHLGEETLPRLVDSFPEADIVVNGHRRSSHDPVRQIGKSLFMQFGYEGKQLSLARFSFASTRKGEPVFTGGEWLSVARQTPPDLAVQSLFNDPAPLPVRNVYDLYLMSLCDYGREALGEFLVFTGKVPDVQWKIWFIGNRNVDSLVSTHGGLEVVDEMRWLAVESLYPEKWPAFLALRSSPDATTPSVVTALGLDTAAIGTWVRRNGRSVLSDHYLRSVRLNVTASPTLYINNSPFERPVESRRLLKIECATRDKLPLWCDSLPSCFDDGECRKKGFIGACGKNGDCSFTPDQKFVFTVVTAESTFHQPEKTIIATTEELFPAVSVRVLGWNTAEGRSIIKACNPLRLPFYRFDRQVVKARHFSRIESGLQPVTGGFTFKDDVTPGNYFPRRKARTGSIDLLVDPVFPDAMKTVATILGDAVLAGKIRVHPVFYDDPATTPKNIDDKVRREEALRWLVLDSFYQAEIAAYLGRYVLDPGSSQQWVTALSGPGIDQVAFMKRVQENERLLAVHWRRFSDLRLQGPIAFLLDNRQLVPLRNSSELGEFLQWLKRRKGR